MRGVLKWFGRTTAQAFDVFHLGVYALGWCLIQLGAIADQ